MRRPSRDPFGFPVPSELRVTPRPGAAALPAGGPRRGGAGSCGRPVDLRAPLRRGHSRAGPPAAGWRPGPSGCSPFWSSQVRPCPSRTSSSCGHSLGDVARVGCVDGYEACSVPRHRGFSNLRRFPQLLVQQPFFLDPREVFVFWRDEWWWCRSGCSGIGRNRDRRGPFTRSCRSAMSRSPSAA